MTHHVDCRCNQGPLALGADVDWVTPHLAVSGQPHEAEIPVLLAMGITHIINVNWPDRPEDEAIQQAFVWRDLAHLDDARPKPPELFQSGIEFAATLGPTDKLLVHCGHGINRGPAMVYAILKSQGYPDAEAMLRRARPQTGGGPFDIYRQSADEAIA
jgi:protein-tyrosine phosphatase